MLDIEKFFWLILYSRLEYGPLKTDSGSLLVHGCTGAS
jgi:hypothetical protein